MTAWRVTFTSHELTHDGLPLRWASSHVAERDAREVARQQAAHYRSVLVEPFEARTGDRWLWPEGVKPWFPYGALHV